MYRLKKSRALWIPVMLSMIISLLAGCGQGSAIGTNGDFTPNMYDSPNAIENLSLATTSSEINTQNPHHSTTGNELALFTNLYDGLTILNTDGDIIPAVASSWEHNEDYTTWTFTLRDNCYWVDYRGEKKDLVTADDFITGLEWILNYWKNGAESIQMSTTFVKGAEDYLTCTGNMTEEEAFALTKEDFLSYVGIEAPDEKTVVYHLSAPCVFFPTVTINVEFLPLSEKHLSEIGISGYQINSYYDAWFNGPYLMTEFIPANEKILDANPYWYGDSEHIRFRSVTLHQVESSAVALQLYKNNEVDRVKLYQSQLKTIIDNPDNPYHNSLVQCIPEQYLYQIFFNFHKMQDDGTEDINWNTAVANEAFRLTWYYGLDMTSYLRRLNSINPEICECTTVVPDNFLKTADGSDYTELVRRLIYQNDNETGLKKLNKELFDKYKAQAIEELTKLGVTFPVYADYYIHSSDQADLDQALVIKDAFSQCFGDDFIVMNICSYSASRSAEVYIPKKQSFARAAWAPDYGDPSSVLANHRYLDDNAWETTYYMNINDYAVEGSSCTEIPGMSDVADLLLEYNRMYDKALNTFDQDTRYQLFAEAEALLINHGLSLPLSQEVNYCLTKIDESSINRSMYGVSRDRYVDWITDRNGYDNSIWED